MSERQIMVQESPAACAQAAEALCIQWIKAAIQATNRCVIVLAGGSTPKLLYERLGKLPIGSIEWNKVIFLWGDERDVGSDHPDSNFRMAKNALLDHLPEQSRPQVHRIRTGDLPANQAALEYDRLLANLLGNDNAKLDIVLLGIGDDAHTASLFPETKGLHESNRLAIENWVEKLKTWRVTLTYKALNQANHVCFLVCGASKTTALRQIWSEPLSIEKYPAQGICPIDGDVTWLIDKAAANGLGEML